MPRRSDFDTEHRDHLDGAVCPKCGATTKWTGIPELEQHVRACTLIELGQLVGEMPPMDDLVPEVPKKPKGWGWSAIGPTG